MLHDVLSKRFTAKHWDINRIVEQSTIDYVVDCTYLAPSKLAARLHKIIILTETPKAKEIKNWLFYNHTHTTDGIRSNKESESVKMFNGQYLAPVVLAWLNPINLPERIERNYGAKTLLVNNPGFIQRHNDIFISSMCAVAAAEEQELNTGFGSCHDHIEVANRLGFDGYECPIIVGIGYAKNMDAEEYKHGILIPIFDPDNCNIIIGYDASNITADRDASPNRNYTQSKENMITTI
jgi:hypothetical protein